MEAKPSISSQIIKRMTDLKENTTFGEEIMSKLRDNGLFTHMQVKKLLDLPPTKGQYELWDALRTKLTAVTIDGAIQAFEEELQTTVVDILKEIRATCLGTTGPSNLYHPGMQNSAQSGHFSGELPAGPAQPQRDENHPTIDYRLEGMIIRIQKRMAKIPPHCPLPLEEFWRTNLSTLYYRTGDGIEGLTLKLYEKGVLDYHTTEKLKVMLTNFDRCIEVYHIIAQKGKLRELLYALKESSNGHVIDLIESWVPVPRENLSPFSKSLGPLPHDVAPVTPASDVLLELKKPTSPKEKLATLDGPPQGASVGRNYVRQEYEVTSRNLKGLALIVNVENYPDEEDRRDGSLKDVERLEGVLDACNIAHVVINDPISKVLSDAITHFQGFFDQPEWKADCCFVFVMAHGLIGSNDFIELSDGGKFPVWTELVAKFSNNGHKSKILKKIPKIFVLNFCRGRDAMAPKKDMSGEPRPPTYAPVFPSSPDWTDMLICYATVQGYAAVRHPQDGTWFIQILCEAIEHYADKYDFVTILDIVSDAIKNAQVKVKGKVWKQMSAYYNIGFDKLFYLKTQQS